MTIIASEDRALVLLSLVGPEATDAVLSSMSGDQAGRLRERLRRIEDSPPTDDEIDDVLDEYDRCLRLAGKLMPAVDELDEVSGDANRIANSRVEDAGPHLQLFDPTDDPIIDLNNLPVQRIAAAVQSEPPHLIAIVLRYLETEKAARTLRELSPQVRAAACVELNRRGDIPHQLGAHLVQSIVDKARGFDDRDLASDEENGDQRVAELLRSMDKVARAEVLSMIEQNDEEMAARVRDLLYVFDDLTRLDDRSVQKLLAEAETSVLSTALFGSAEELQEKVFKNLSKRAQQALREELEFKGTVSDEELTEARNAIVQVLTRLDQAGELVMLDD